MKKKIKDITIGDMVATCNLHSNEPCAFCPLFNKICGRIPYEIKCNEDPDKEIEL